MTDELRIDGELVDRNTLSPEAQKHLSLIQFAEAKLLELSNMQALLRRAQRSYLDGLKNEIVKSRSGVDLSNLLTD